MTTTISQRISGIKVSSVREIFDIAQGFSDVIILGIGEPNFKTPAFVNDAAKKAIDEGFDEYTANKGTLELREAIASKLKTENLIDADPKTEIIVTAGATQAIFLIMGSLLDEGDEALVPTPMFPANESTVKLCRGVPLEIPLEQSEGYSVNFEELARRCTKRSKVLVLNSPTNPTGMVRSEKEIRQLAEFALEHDLYLLSDEIYEKYLYDGAKHYSAASNNECKDRIITVNGFSKTYGMTGWRLAYAVANEQVISAVNRFHMYASVCANSIAQIAGIAALNGGYSFFEPILEKYRKMRDIVCKHLEEMSLPYVAPKGAFYVFPEISSITRESDTYCKELLINEHVATVPGSGFGRIGEGHIRLSFSTEVKLLEEALEKMKRFNTRFRPNF